MQAVYSPRHRLVPMQMLHATPQIVHATLRMLHALASRGASATDASPGVDRTSSGPALSAMPQADEVRTKTQSDRCAVDPTRLIPGDPASPAGARALAFVGPWPRGRGENRETFAEARRAGGPLLGRRRGGRRGSPVEGGYFGGRERWFAAGRACCRTATR